jgi:hypothetical protein
VCYIKSSTDVINNKLWLGEADECAYGGSNPSTSINRCDNMSMLVSIVFNKVKKRNKESFGNTVLTLTLFCEIIPSSAILLMGDYSRVFAGVIALISVLIGFALLND